MPGLYNKYIKPLHASGDAASIAVSSIAAYILVYGNVNFYQSTRYLELLLFALLSWLICTSLLGTYKFYRVTRTDKVVINALKVILLYILLIEATLNIINVETVPRSFLIYHYAILTILVVAYRFTVITALHYYRKKGYNNRKVIIVGNGKTGQELKRFFKTHPEHGYHFIGFFDDKLTGDPWVIGRVSEIESFVIEHEIDEIYCCPFELERDQVVRLMNFVDDNLIRMKFLPEPGSFPYAKLKIDFYDMLPVLIFRSIPLDETINKVAKRAFDIAFSSLVILFFLSWLIPLLALLIKLDSKGPIFFGQERSGINYKTFRCWKLRSMYINNEANSLLAKRGDSRITPIGAFLRKTSLDELPQFFNVLMGHMSIVGPRPHMLKVNEEYALVAEKYMVRHFIKPGITGLSQVRGYRGDTSADYQIRGRVKLDIFYLENWTFFLDLKIIFYTVYNMLRGEDNAF
ncbi:sugar transferase [Pontibacter sp. HJ8]